MMTVRIVRTGSRRISLLFFWLAALTPAFAQGVPNRYILILEDSPTLAQVARREDLQRAAAVNVRQQIETKQAAIRDRLAAMNISVTRSVSTVMNAIFVVAARDQVPALQSIPGVIGVLPVRQYRKSLNRALSLVDAPTAWNLPGTGGVANAGKGVKVAVIDDGIELANPMFQASSLAMPAGFPLCSGWEQAATQCKNYTNSKVIVARSYVKLLAGFGLNGSAPDPAKSRPDDYTPISRDGHGTAVASVVGGVSATGAAVTANGTPILINGMAPGVYLGNYKIYGSPQLNDSTGDDVIIAALEDAVNDHMDVISFSSGGPATTGPLDAGAVCGNPAGVPCDLAAQAFENAAKGGVIIVAAAGNDGATSDFYPNFNSISSPGDAPSVIAVGATSNSHLFNETVQVPGSGIPTNLQDIAAAFSNANVPLGSITAPLTDVAALDGNGLACSALPSGSLKGQIALIERGSCSFQQKMLNAISAGVFGVIFYDNTGAAVSPSICSSSGSCTTPAVASISNADGLALKKFIASNPGHPATIDPNGSEALDTSGTGQNLLAGFSSFGPSAGGDPSTGGTLIKPDLVAVGEGDAGNPGGIYMAASTNDPLGALYSSDGFIAADGTSFATPMVAGAAAIVKQNHPTFTAAQVKSALVNSATQDVKTDDSASFGFAASPVDVEWLGGGKLDAGAAASATVSASPVTLSFGAISAGSLPKALPLTITNNGATAVSLSVAIASTSTSTTASGTACPASLPSLSATSLSVAPGASSNVTVTLSGTVPAPCQYSGLVTPQGSGVSLRVPYMYLVSDGIPQNIFAMLGDGDDGTVNQVIPDGMMALKFTDFWGLPVPNVPVTFTATTAGGTVASIATPTAASATLQTTTDQYGIAYAVATLGPQPGTYTFTGGCATCSGGSALNHTFNETARAAPAINSGGVVNNASYAVGKPVAPGAYVSIFGSGLSDVTDFAPSTTLPLSLDFVTVSFDVPSANISLPGNLLYVSPNQVNVQVPWELRGQSSVQVKVTIDQSYGNVVSVPLADYAPGLIEFSPGVVAAQDVTFNGIGTSNPAKRGQQIAIYGLGLGPVTNQPATGQVASSSPLSQTTSTPAVTIGGQLAQVVFSGLSAGWSSLYQVNVIVPTNISPGNQPVSLSIGGATSNTSGIMVQ